jgi:hypothetical protein
VCRADGSITTIADVVEQRSLYIRANRDDMFWVTWPRMQFNPQISATEDIPADTKLPSFFFFFFA